MASAQRERAEAGHWPILRVLAGVTEYRRPQRLYPAASPGEPAVVSHQLLGADAVVVIPQDDRI